MRWAVLESPIGPFSVASDDTAICGAHFGVVVGAVTEPDSEQLRRALGELRAYFARELTAFTLPLSVRRGGS
jgi:methylated-DNA-[protein]-cysteine S-methyltransferase